jgi:hypothetical protein
MAEERQTVSVNYLTQFYYDLENLTSCVAQYSNLLALFQGKYSDADLSQLKEMPVEDKNQILNFCQQSRFYAIRCYTKFLALSKKIPEFEEQTKEIEKDYREILQNNVPSFEVMQSFVSSVNTLFVSGIADKYLESKEESANKQQSGSAKDFAARQ